MNAIDSHPQILRAWRPAGFGLALLALPGYVGFAADAPEKSEPASGTAAEPAKEKLNWVEFAVGGTIVDGNAGQFQRRTQLPSGVYGGIESFHFEETVKKTGVFKVDGRGIFDEHDYGLSLELSDPKKGFFKAGYESYRSYYDGSGGYYPSTGSWYSIYDDELWVDRQHAWFEAGLTLPDKPQLTLRYDYYARDGRKDSTSWGEAILPGGAMAGIVPSYLELEEARHVVSLDLRHHVGKSDLGLGLRYDGGSNDNSRNLRLDPGASRDRHVTSRDGLDFDMFSAHAYNDTRLNDVVRFSMGFAYTRMDTDLSGSRIFGSSYEPIFDPVYSHRRPLDTGFLDLSGGSSQDQYLWNVNFMITPVENLAIVPALRVEKLETDSISQWTGWEAASSTAPVQQDRLSAISDKGLLEVSESLEARYTGVTNWVFYARGAWTQGDGDIAETERQLVTGIVDLNRKSDLTRFVQKYTAGANWYPLRKVNLGAQYYHKIRNDDFDHPVDPTPSPDQGQYPAFIRAHDFTTDDVNFRITWRPRNNLTLASRYDFQMSNVDMQGELLSAVETSEITSHIFSETITWSPLTRLYLQGSLSYVIDETDTPAAEAIAAPGNLVVDSDNGYWNASLSAGYALDDKTDLQATYFYYHADNWEGTAVASVPYGAGAEEHGVTAAIIRRLTDSLRLTLRYGFFTNDDPSAGGYNDYTAHQIYSSLQYRF